MALCLAEGRLREPTNHTIRFPEGRTDSTILVSQQDSLPDAGISSFNARVRGTDRVFRGPPSCESHRPSLVWEIWRPLTSHLG